MVSALTYVCGSLATSALKSKVGAFPRGVRWRVDWHSAGGLMVGAETKAWDGVWVEEASYTWGGLTTTTLSSSMHTSADSGFCPCSLLLNYISLIAIKLLHYVMVPQVASYWFTGRVAAAQLHMYCDTVSMMYLCW